MSYQQIPLDLRLRAEATFDNFVVSGNESLLHSLRDEQERYVYLWGGSASGKSHLLQALCHEAWQGQQAVAYIPLAEPEICDPEVFAGLEVMDLICIDDVQRVAGHTAWETALFNLFNLVREGNGRLIIAATEAPNQTGIKLPDLVSRLNWGAVFQIQAPRDEDKIAVLQLRAAQLGLELPADIAAYMLKRSPRDMASLFALLHKLDKASLTEQRRLTIPFIRQYL